MTPAVVFEPRAERQLLEIYEWIAEAGDPEIGAQFVGSIVDYCESLADMPGIGLARDDIRAGIRTVGFRRRAVIAFQVGSTTIFAGEWRHSGGRLSRRFRIRVSAIMG